MPSNRWFHDCFIYAIKKGVSLLAIVEETLAMDAVHSLTNGGSLDARRGPLRKSTFWTFAKS